MIELEGMKRELVQKHNEVGLSPSACAFVFEGFPHCKALNGNKVQMLVCSYGHANEVRALPHIDFNSFISNTLK